MRGRLMVGLLPLKESMNVRIVPPQPSIICRFKTGPVRQDTVKINVQETIFHFCNQFFAELDLGKSA